MSRLTIDKRMAIVKSESNRKFYDEIEELKNKLKQMIQKEADKRVPTWITDEMMQSGYISMSCSVTLELNRNRNEMTRAEKILFDYISTINAIPSKRFTNHLIKASKSMQSLFDKIIAKGEEKKKFESKLSYVLSKFTTEKRMIEALPELEQYVSKGTSNALISVDTIKDIRKELNKPKRGKK